VIYDGFACDGAEVPADASLVEALAGAHERVAGEKPALVAATATTDARAFIGAGIPAVCFGPHAENIHGIDERVLLSSMISTAQTLGVFIRDWCGLAG
jgi:acetylornithine deacetylase